MTYPKKLEKGFTLIELITVVAIIALISSVILTNFSISREKANNTKMKIEVKSVANALYLARDPVSGVWPGVNGWQCLKASGNCFNNNYTGNATIATALLKYVSTIPSVPTALFGVGTYGYDSYLYNRSFSGIGGYPSGAYLLWEQTLPMTNQDCGGYVDSSMEVGHYYCYEFLGS